jgi:hypothetical protein
VPRVKAEIGGRELTFAPLLIGQLRKLQSIELPPGNLDRIDFWLPLIKSSIERAGGTMPDTDAMDIDEINAFFTEALENVLKASGARTVPQGEGQLAADPANGTTSSVSLSPLPAIESAT